MTERIKAGHYTIVVAPIWNEIALTNPDYQKITVVSHALKGIVQSVKVLPNQKENLAFLATVFKNLCRNTTESRVV